MELLDNSESEILNAVESLGPLSLIVMGAQADPELLKAEANAHHKAIGSISDPNGMTPKADWDGVNITLGRAWSQYQSRRSWIVQLGVIHH